jgi:hypothetical protein
VAEKRANGDGRSRAGAKAKPGAGEAKPKRIAKAGRDAPVQASIAGLPGREPEVEERQDAPIEPASELITARIRELQDWRGEKLALVRKLIHEADPAILEEWKWMGTPVWSHDGIVCTGETYKQIVKLTFAKGAFLADPQHLFNAGFTGNTRRAIDLRAEDELDRPSFRELIREAVAFNQDHAPKRRRSPRTGSSGR